MSGEPVALKVTGRLVPANSPDRADDGERIELGRGNDLTSEAAWLAQVARAYTSSPVA